MRNMFREILLGLSMASTGAAGSGPEAKPQLVEYAVTERVHSLSPHGDSSWGLAGRVSVSAERARWELTAGTFPHTTATTLLLDRQSVTLLDGKQKSAATASLAELDAILRGSATGEIGGTGIAFRGVVASLQPRGAGRLFQGETTRRYRVEVRWVLGVTTPGRVNELHNELVGTLELCDSWTDAGSVLDDVGRLLPLRGEARKALEDELRKVSGFPVFATFELTSEQRSDPVGVPGPEREAPAPSPRSVTSVTRSVSQMKRRPREKSDESRFTVPEEFRGTNLDRLLLGAPALP